MKIASVAEIKAQFSAFLKASEEGPVVVTRNGRPVAVIVGIDDEDEIERLLMAYSPRLQAILEASRKQIREAKQSVMRKFGRKWKRQEFQNDDNRSHANDTGPRHSNPC